MKKLLLYILIIITLIGIFSPAIKIYAADSASPTLGTCRQGTEGTSQSGITQQECVSKNVGLNSAETKWIWIPYYYPLSPLPDPSNNRQPQGPFDPTQPNNLSNYLNLIIKLFIGICAVLAVIMIVVGGIEYMTSELPGLKSEGKNRIIQAILGLLLALGAWTLLYTINPKLLDTSLKTLTDVTVEATVDQPQVAVNGKYADGSVVGTAWRTDLSSATLPNGVTVNHGGVECTTVGQQNCTSTKGLDPYIVNSIKSDCPSCQVVITGGTESWAHSANSSHKPGSATVDFSATADLNKEITGSTSFPTDGSVYEDKAKKICYFAEGAGTTSSTTAKHWHAYKC
jgi:type IV secretory pathway VirB2 component (pilin)